MLHNTPSLAALIKALQHVPYVASKNIYRVATYFLQSDERAIEHFCYILRQAKLNIQPCQTCFVWREKERDCSFCSNTKRSQDLVCIVESWQDMLAIEKTGGYQGAYHVLGGVICPLEGIGPENLTIQDLINRIDTHNVREIILALNQTPEGEATSSYIAQKVREKNITVSCLARGIPVGSLLESMDRVTVYKALAERRPF